MARSVRERRVSAAWWATAPPSWWAASAPIPYWPLNTWPSELGQLHLDVIVQDHRRGLEVPVQHRDGHLVDVAIHDRL